MDWDDDDDEDDDDGEKPQGAVLQRNTFPWVKKEKRKSKHKIEAPAAHTITAEQVARVHGVPRGHFKRYLEAEIEESEACQSLAFTMIFVWAYAFMVIFQDDAATMRAVEDSIEFDIEENANFAFDLIYDGARNMGHKTVDDVNSHTDFWSWLQNGFMPLMIQQGRGFSEGTNYSDPRVIATSETFNREDRGFVLSYNRIVGGIRLRQERSSPSRCDTLGNLLDFYDSDCVKGLGFELDPELRTAKQVNDPQRVAWLYIHSDMEELQEQVLQMETEGWLDRQTKKIEILVPVYNAEYGLHSIVTINFFFSRGGHIFKRLIPMSVYADRYRYWYNIFFTVLFLICLLYILIAETIDVLKTLSRSGVNGLYTEYLSIWNIVDWISIMVGLLVIFMSIVNQNMTVQANSAMIDLGNMDENTNRVVYREQAEFVVALLERNINYMFNLRLLLACYPLIVVFRLFKAFSAQPRLAAVTDTLVESGQDLAHFLIVFMSVFCSFTISGVILFGRMVDDFATVPRAVHHCFRALLGDFDWDELRVVGRVAAAGWLVCFVVVVPILLLNMLLAILLDAYEIVKARMGTAETLVEEGRQVIQRFLGQKRGDIVPLGKIVAALDHEQKMQELEHAVNAAELADHLGWEERKKKHHQAHLGSSSGDDSIDLDPETGEVVQDDTKTAQDYEDEPLNIQSILDSVDKEFPNGKYILSDEQALQLSVGAVQAYYDEHNSGASMTEVLKTFDMVEMRTKLIKDTHKMAQKRDPLNEKVRERFRDFAQEFREIMQDSLARRKELRGNIRRLRKETTALRQMIKWARSNAQSAPQDASKQEKRYPFSTVRADDLDVPGERSTRDRELPADPEPPGGASVTAMEQTTYLPPPSVLKHIQELQRESQGAKTASSNRWLCCGGASGPPSDIGSNPSMAVDMTGDEMDPRFRAQPFDAFTPETLQRVSELSRASSYAEQSRRTSRAGSTSSAASAASAARRAREERMAPVISGGPGGGVGSFTEDLDSWDDADLDLGDDDGSIYSQQYGAYGEYKQYEADDVEVPVEPSLGMGSVGGSSAHESWLQDFNLDELTEMSASDFGEV